MSDRVIRFPVSRMPKLLALLDLGTDDRVAEVYLCPDSGIVRTESGQEIEVAYVNDRDERYCATTERD